MEFTSSGIGTEEYYNRFIELQERLRKSEEERLQLEMKFNAMIQTTQDEEQLYYKRLKGQYKRFVEESHRRRQRNEELLDMLERIESRAAVFEAKTQRFKLLRNQYHSFLARMEHERRFRNAPSEDPLTLGALQQNIDPLKPHRVKLIGDLGSCRVQTADKLLAAFKEQSNEVDIAADIIGTIKERRGMCNREGMKKVVMEDDTDESTTSVIISHERQPMQGETKLECEDESGSNSQNAQSPKVAEFVEKLDENQNSLTSYSVQDAKQVQQPGSDLGPENKIITDLQEENDEGIGENILVARPNNIISNVQSNDHNLLELNSKDNFAKHEVSPIEIDLSCGDIEANLLQQSNVNSNSSENIINMEEQANQSVHLDTAGHQAPSVPQEDIPVDTLLDGHQQLTATDGTMEQYEQCQPQEQYDEHPDTPNMDPTDLQNMQELQNSQIYYDNNDQPVQYDPNLYNQQDLQQYENYQYDENGQPVDYSQISRANYDENGQLINYSHDPETAEQSGVEYENENYATNDPGSVEGAEANYDGYNYELTQEDKQDEGQNRQVTAGGEIFETYNKNEENTAVEEMAAEPEETPVANVMELLETESENTQNVSIASTDPNKMVANENESDFDFSSASGQENLPGIQN